MWIFLTVVQESDEAHKGSFTPTPGDVTFARVKKRKKLCETGTLIEEASSSEDDIEVQDWLKERNGGVRGC